MQAHVFILGFVQGVGYRQFVKSKSKKAWAKRLDTNLSDGRVEAVFSGDKESIEKMLEICKKGPFFSQIKA